MEIDMKKALLVINYSERKCEVPHRLPVLGKQVQSTTPPQKRLDIAAKAAAI